MNMERQLCGCPPDRAVKAVSGAAIIEEVERYVNTATGQHGAQTAQTRRVVKALRLLGIARSGFTARTERLPDGTYGQAVGSIHWPADQFRVIQNAELLVHCGLVVHILNSTPGRESAFVATPGFTEYDVPQIVRHVRVSSPTTRHVPRQTTKPQKVDTSADVERAARSVSVELATKIRDRQEALANKRRRAQLNQGLLQRRVQGIGAPSSPERRD